MRVRFRFVIAALVALASVHSAHADGGRLRFRKAAGPFIVTLFTTPDPLTQGRADFSVVVERSGQPGLIEDADIHFILTPRHGQPIMLRASRAGATSKWLQAANFRIPARGVWRVTVLVRRGDQAGQCSGTVRVGGGGTRDLVWDVLPVPLMGLFLLAHWYRKRRYRREHRTHLISSSC
jgi:hypothetical protein